MGKRSDFERMDRDFYPTPLEAVYPLLPHLHYKTYVEPCAGDGSLVHHLHNHGMICYGASDIEPQGVYCKEYDIWISKREPIAKRDCFEYIKWMTDPSIMGGWFADADCVITNPPWSREFLHPFIEQFSEIKPTWLLFDADWMHTKQAEPYLKKCEKIVSVGRVKWIPDSKMTGKDNCCWYLFQKNPTGPTKFYGRVS